MDCTSRDGFKMATRGSCSMDILDAASQGHIELGIFLLIKTSVLIA